MRVQQCVHFARYARSLSIVVMLVCPYARSICTVRKHKYFLYLKSVLDNSGSRQGQEATNSTCQEATISTCHEVMRVHKNEQVFTNKQWLLSSALRELFLLIFPSLSFSSPLFFSPFLTFCLAPPPPPPLFFLLPTPPTSSSSSLSSFFYIF